MLKVIGNKIFLTRGDSAELDIGITDMMGDGYEMQDGDQLTFTVKKTVNDHTAVISKPISDGVILVEPKDTAGLPYGVYVYDLQFNGENGTVFTIIPPSPFVITEEVTF